MATHPHVLVCVTGQKTCERLIVEGHRLAEELHAELTVLHVAKNGLHFLGSLSEAEALEYLYQISSEHGAALMVMRSDDVVSALHSYALKIGAVAMVFGAADHREQREQRNIVREVELLLPHVQMHVVYA